MTTRNHRTFSGFTLVELMVSIVVVAALATATVATVGAFRVKSAGVNELARMRSIGIALFGWAGEHQGRLPRSSHSATGHGELGWQREILPYLGYPDTSRETLALARPREFGMDPAERPPRAPALNVYYELNPDYDDYEGAPRKWRDPSSISNPSATVLAVMAFGTADHIMAQYFNDRVDHLPAPGNGADKGCVLWYDGSTTLAPPGSVFDPSKGIDRFHPDKAR